MAIPSVGSCCHNCTERFPACHDVCVTYLQAKAERDAWLDLVHANKEKERGYIGYHYQRITKTKKVMSNKSRDKNKR